MGGPPGPPLTGPPPPQLPSPPPAWPPSPSSSKEALDWTGLGVIGSLMCYFNLFLNPACFIRGLADKHYLRSSEFEAYVRGEEPFQGKSLLEIIEYEQLQLRLIYDPFSN